MSKNYFAAFDSDDEGPAPAKKAPKKKEPPKKAPIAEPSRQGGAGGRGGDGGRGGRGGRGRPNNNDRNTRGGRGGRVPARDGKRAYDRRSGTGRGRETKKGGGGAHNWGNDKNDARQAEGAVKEGEEEEILNPTPEGQEGAKKPEGGEEGGAPKKEEQAEPEPEPEDKSMTYEEYLKSKQKPDSEAFASLSVKELDENNEFAGKAARAKAEEEDFLSTKGGKSLRKKGGKGNKGPKQAWTWASASRGPREMATKGAGVVEVGTGETVTGVAAAAADVG
eukprot:CAMPEP_0113596576 /NCGR_PEP_ID=MMETSP0015_2-20120614/40420_1 /TAXON_ID=2838 /ORGANISM="Odontella" /LENGTH=277 /DNA_ID=CAMNT_0000504121 /DNA_START=233 /DNA_END=1063 /DNA_ORIENTATION=- /assembly_acc=CAM_ASM_000160